MIMRTATPMINQVHHFILPVYTITDLLSSVYRVTDMGRSYYKGYGKKVGVLFGSISADTLSRLKSRWTPCGQNLERFLSRLTDMTWVAYH